MTSSGSFWNDMTNRKYWLLKSEPSCYSIDDLKRDKAAQWTGVRNFQARNLMQSMEVGDYALFYHSNTTPPHVAGVAKVVAAAHPDLTALDEGDDHYDPKASKDKPVWFGVDVAFVRKFKRPVTLEEIKSNPRLEGIPVAQTGSRLSVQPVVEEHFREIEEMASA